MTLRLNTDGADDDLPDRSEEADTTIQRASLYGALPGQIAVGRHLLQISEPSGAVLREALRTERAHIRPRPTPILLRPRLIRGLFDRRTELTSALSALDSGLPIEVSGEPGVGKTAFLRHLAHHPRAASFVDGIVYLTARHQASADVVQLLFEAFYESEEICKPTEAEIRRCLQDKQALILLDDVHLPQHELEEVLDIAPRSAFAVATRDRCLWGEVRSILLKGLPEEDALLLFEREIERPFRGEERSAAATICAAIEGHPLRILQAAAITRQQGISPAGGGAGSITPSGLIKELTASIDDKQRRALLALTALPGVPLHAQHVSNIADVPDIEPPLMALVRLGLVVSSQSRHRLASGVADRLRRTEDPKPWVNRAITYFTAWAERHRRNAGKLLEESEALLRAQQCASETRRFGEVLHLGRLLEASLVLGARWGAWATSLERCLEAAKAIGDRSLEAWALHEMGTRAVCLGEPGMARASLSQAVKLREALGETAAAAASRLNLGFVLAPAPDHPRERGVTSLEDALDVDSLPLRDEAPPAIRASKTNSVWAVSLVVCLLAILAALAYQAVPGASSNFRSLAGLGSLLHSGPGGAAASARTAAARQPPRTVAEPRVLQFSAVPDRVAPGETVRLCYGVVNGAHVRIEPDIGELVDPRQSCVTATPMETTTYTLTVSSADGESLRQTVRVLVGPAGSQASGLDEPVVVPSGAVPESAVVTPAPPAPQAPAEDRPNILIFTARPGSISAGGPTQLCYAVTGASRARIEPGLGEVHPAGALTCLRVAPVRTTTYELTAYSRDGHHVREQLVIVVR
jgi:hypothetical protein